jgi:hypothetical protein
MQYVTEVVMSGGGLSQTIATLSPLQEEQQEVVQSMIAIYIVPLI